MAELEAGGTQYRTGKLNGLLQWEIFCRLGPMIPALTAEFRDGITATPGARWVMGAVSGALGSLKQEDRDTILMTCLAVVERYDPTVQRWFRLAANGRLMYEDIDLLTMLELMDLTLQENLAPFFARLRTDSVAVEAEETAPVAATGLH
jgi:hypothetical protein